MAKGEGRRGAKVNGEGEGEGGWWRRGKEKRHRWRRAKSGGWTVEERKREEICNGSARSWGWRRWRADERKNQREERQRWRANEGKNQREERRQRHPRWRGRGGGRQEAAARRWRRGRGRRSATAALDLGDGVSASRLPPHDLLRFHTKCTNAITQPEILHTVLNRLYNGNSPYTDFPPPAIAQHLYPPCPPPLRMGLHQPRLPRPYQVRPPPHHHRAQNLPRRLRPPHGLHLPQPLPPLILCIDDFRGWPGFHEPFTRDVPPPHHADALLLPQFMLAVTAAGKADHVIPLPFSTVSAFAILCDRADEGKN